MPFKGLISPSKALSGFTAPIIPSSAFKIIGPHQSVLDEQGLRRERRAYKKQYYQTQKSINFANEDERKRGTNFQLDLRDCFSHKCICCHKIMSISGVAKKKVRFQPLVLDRHILKIFDFSPLIGNDILLSNPYGSVYKIHGCFF